MNIWKFMILMHVHSGTWELVVSLKKFKHDRDWLMRSGLITDNGANEDEEPYKLMCTEKGEAFMKVILADIERTEFPNEEEEEELDLPQDRYDELTIKANLNNEKARAERWKKLALSAWKALILLKNLLVKGEGKNNYRVQINVADTVIDNIDDENEEED